MQWKGGNPAINSVEITGPHRVEAVGDTPSRAKVFVCRPKRIADEDTLRHEDPFHACSSRVSPTGHGRGRSSAARCLQVRSNRSGLRSRDSGGADPNPGRTRVLFLIEPGPAAVKARPLYRLSDLELASRLSFFLWSSIPDDELLKVAESGNLKDPVIMDRQVRRMLADPRFATAFARNFAAQWLQLRNLGASEPDRELFPEFDENGAGGIQAGDGAFPREHGARGPERPETGGCGLYVSQ